VGESAGHQDVGWLARSPNCGAARRRAASLLGTGQAAFALRGIRQRHIDTAIRAIGACPASRMQSISTAAVRNEAGKGSFSRSPPMVRLYRIRRCSRVERPEVRRSMTGLDPGGKLFGGFKPPPIPPRWPTSARSSDGHPRGRRERRACRWARCDRHAMGPGKSLAVQKFRSRKITGGDSRIADSAALWHRRGPGREDLQSRAKGDYQLHSMRLWAADARGAPRGCAKKRGAAMPA